ncbi:MAG: aminotransferase class V-fold PLP-dependent enzyme [Gammaproteobacteria bacterium]|nr:aminotransferase class V-fold PLP-dependent enzyme [Gammaproteobacteria bacterium]
MRGPEEGSKAHANSRNPGNVQHGLGMTPEMMLDLARKAAELVVERIENLPRGDAWDGDFRETLEHKLMVDPPEHGRPGVEVLEEAARDILPYAMRLDHPKCFAFVPSAPTWPGVLADFMAAGFNINECTWLVASGASQVELVVLEWFRQWLGYPDGAGGLLTSGGSAASVDAFVAAREAAGSPDRATVYMSDQSHSAFVRAAMIVGVRRDCIRMIPCDERFRLDMAALTAAVAEDRAAGCNPIAICANAGATATGAVDPLVAMADYCAAEGIWLHVDAAYGGFAVITGEGRELLRGIERADSVGLDAHKWLFQPYEAGCLLVKDVRTLEEPFGVRPDFLQDTVWGANHPNFTDRGLQLSRSFRALKIWMSIQTFGMAAFRQAVAQGMEFAARAEDYVRASPVLEILNPASLGVIVFRFNPADAGLGEESLEAINQRVLTGIFWEDNAFISSARPKGTFALRLCIINHNTTWDDVRETLEAIERFGAEALSAE